MTALFSIAYLPPVSYLQQCINVDEIIIEQHEHFIKQTYRNRCQIYSPNGMQSLIIPVVHQNLFRSPIKDIRISFDSPWHRVHWKAICSAYRNSPYFEFYEDEFHKVYEKPETFLFDFNLNLIKIIFDLFKIKKTISLTENFENEPPSPNDFRNIFHPKKKSSINQPYHQVFSDRFGFINDLSCVDYLFNEGKK